MFPLLYYQSIRSRRQKIDLQINSAVIFNKLIHTVIWVAWFTEHKKSHLPAAPPSALPNVELIISTLPSTPQYSSVPLHTAWQPEYVSITNVFQTENCRKYACKIKEGPLIGSSSLLTFELVMVRPNYASSPGRRAPCYTELAVSSPSVAETIAGTQCTYPRKDGQAQWPGKYRDDRPTKGGHQSQY